ncbi:3-oxoacyl-[acyl-carrier-protein] synthase II, chloroplastic [Apostasia shenzhenica]|uniref:beta-ketoacyl-[acyl-carrier-protein] synthase I n=1 Tax=Apostasia shenzhenica TaxID=1088818 RepID=A0A2I0A9T8_9ASPA|nr:3-oxoacyl-[acyl-carrier-protein] synthase II, chloroplastic [Apostasia shenzhenica]
MVDSAMASPLCTWLVAACMSVSSEKDRARGSPEGMLARRWRNAAVAKGGLGLVARGSSNGLLSGFCGSGIHGLVNSLQPCPEFYSSRNGSPIFGEIGLPFFGTWKVESSRRHRRDARSFSAPGKVMAVAIEPAKLDMEKKRTSAERRRVVVTGMGVVTPLGHDPNVFYNNLLEGASGISQIEAFDCTNYPTRIAGEIKSFSTEGWVSPKLSKRMDKFMLYLLTAGKKALVDGGLLEEVLRQLDKTRCGVLIGSAMGGMKDRDGFVMGEGAGVLLLEELQHAKQRGANIYAEFLGGSLTCDAYHMTEPHPEGAGIALCIEKALSDSGISKENVNYINAHATSTLAGDVKEYEALVRCFGRNPEDASILVGSKKERLDVKVALSNSFGFGGHNSSILYS